MGNRPRGICPICLTNQAARWEADLLLMKAHKVAGRGCPGEGRPVAEDAGALLRAASIAGRPDIRRLAS